ncbi:MAG: hypothetical protein Q7W02_24405 [Candidatus Rokubacteria bacterium]|nr:hypothetical protein [Candidatus Rokubacteria bacterium]
MTIARAREILRWEGVTGFLTRGIRKLLRPVVRVRCLLFFEMDLTQPFPVIEARVPVTMRVATAEDLDTLADELTSFWVNLAAAREQLDRGDLLCLTFANGTLVNRGWVTFSSPSVEELGVLLELQPGESCLYGSVTRPEWRGFRIEPAAALFRNGLQRARGYRRHISWVWADNQANVRPQATRGRRVTKRVWTVWIWGMRRPLLFGATRKGSPSLVRPAAPRLPTRPPGG